MIENAHVLTIL